MSLEVGGSRGAFVTKIVDHTIVPAALAIRGHKSAHSFATGPAMAEPFISPFGLMITPALSSK